jgi:hypothetical protein
MRLPSRRPLVLAAALAAALTCGSILPTSAQDLPLPPPVTLLTRDLTGWTADRTRARVEAGVVRVEPGAGWLRFDRVLANFVLTMDVRLPSPEAKAGIFVRSWPTFDSKRGIPNNAYRVVASQSGAGVEAAGRVVTHGRTSRELYDLMR